ncbi:MAG: NUDIX hydrolase [Chloroflexi bacterium]|nr:NUDIX hydrolase [Chloroflexota bacterium]
MQHRIRAAALIVKKGRLLLVKHVHPESGSVFWVPPGGGVNAGQESIYDAATREVLEETGLRVTLGRILYIREFVDMEMHLHNLELFILADRFDGKLTIDNLRPGDLDSRYIKEVGFLSPAEMRDLNIFPHELKAQFWMDIESGATAKYLGQQVGDSRKLPET